MAHKEKDCEIDANLEKKRNRRCPSEDRQNGRHADGRAGIIIRREYHRSLSKQRE